MKSTIIIYAISLLVFSIFCGIISWKYLDYFISRKDLYVNSRYKLYTKKIWWCFGVAFTVFAIGMKLMVYIFKK